MNFRALLVALPLLALMPHLVGAEEGEDFIIPSDEFYVPKMKISVGFHMQTSGAKVAFGGLGEVPSIRIVQSGKNVNRVYDNGYVGQDGLRVAETDTGGSQVALNSGRYSTYTTVAIDANTTVTEKSGDFLGYQDGQTRLWGFSADSQVSGNTLTFSNYSAKSEGGTAKAEQGSNTGIEIQLERDMRKIGKRFSLAFGGGVSVNSINARTDGSVTATLSTYSEKFTILGTPPTAPYTGPSFDPYNYTINGVDQTNEQGNETTVPISDEPLAGQSTTVDTPGGAQVAGNWKIKGAYLMMRFGPTMRLKLSENFGLSATLGLAAAFTGTRYSFVETIETLNLAEPITVQDSSSTSAFLPGYYADLNIEWLATEKSGLYCGANLQNLGGYNQSVGGRTARIDLGNSVGFRGGLSFKF